MDAEANTLSGQVLGAGYPAWVEGEIWEEGAPWPETQTDDEGHFTLNFNPFDIQPWMEVAAWYIQPDRNWVGAVFCGRAEDLNCDNKIDIEDIQRAANAWRTRVGELEYNPRADQNQDGRIDIRDIMKVAAAWSP